MMTRLFFGTLQGVAFEWFKRLRHGCIKSWNDLERKFLQRFPDCDVEFSSVTLASIKQKEGEPIRDYIERFRRIAGRTRGGLPQRELVEFCRQSLTRNVRQRFGVTPISTWEELTHAGDRAELETMLDLEDQPPRSDQRGRSRGNGRDAHTTETQCPTECMQHLRQGFKGETDPRRSTPSTTSPLNQFSNFFERSK